MLTVLSVEFIVASGNTDLSTRQSRRRQFFLSLFSYEYNNRARWSRGIFKWGRRDDGKRGGTWTANEPMRERHVSAYSPRLSITAADLSKMEEMPFFFLQQQNQFITHTAHERWNHIESLYICTQYGRSLRNKGGAGWCTTPTPIYLYIHLYI